MTKRSSPFLLGITAVSALAAPGAFSAGLAGAAFAAEPAGVAIAASPAAQPADGWYQFGPAATVVEREEIASDRVTLLTLSNGVRLVLKPTSLVEDEVKVNVIVDGGHQSLAPGSRAAAEIAETMFLSGGVGLKSHDELVAAFGPAVSSIEFNIWTPWFNLGATGQSDELRPLLEVLTAYVSDPGWRFEGLDAVKVAEIENADLMKSQPYVALQVHSPGVLTSGDPRRLRPTHAQIMAVDEVDARRAIESQFQAGAIEIAIVGDFDPEEAIAMVASTFGSLPARAGIDPVQSAPPRFPAPTTTPLEITFAGAPGEQGRLVAWPAPMGLFKSEEEQAISAMLGVMVFRLMDLPAYESAGFAKGLSAQNGYLSISAISRQENLANFEADVARIARDIVANGVTQEEIDRAQAPHAADVRFVEANAMNQYWIVTAMNLKGDPANWEKARSILTYVEGVTPEEVHRAATRYFVEGTSVSVVANPEPAPRAR